MDLITKSRFLYLTPLSIMIDEAPQTTSTTFATVKLVKTIFFGLASAATYF
ncbi:MAG: hypothetical protein WCG98_01005 [bacterium]